MKNKKLTYILLPGAVLIWAIVIYRIVSAVEPTQPNQPVAQLKVEMDAETQTRDSFVLQLNYRDPFLGSTPRPPKTNKPVASKSKKKPKKPKVKQWPDITYHGIIRNEKSGEELAVVKIEGREYLMKPGMREQEVRVSSFSAEQIKLEYSDENKTIEKL